MKAKFLITSLIVIGLASPASSAPARKFYVVQNTKTLKCSILPKKPKGKTVVIVSGSTSYKSRNAARIALGNSASCKA